MVFFGQVVVGPPGSGKTTYCHGMKIFIEALGRKCAIVNLDFANDHFPYDVAIDVRELVSLPAVMEEVSLGPNGGLVYCMEYLLANVEWLEERLRAANVSYFLFDFPGQVELYTHHKCVQVLLERLTAMDMRLCSVHLVDSFYCCEPATFISATLLVASSMLRLSLPHVNVLSKIDLLKHYGPLPFNLDFFTEMLDLTPLARFVTERPRHLDALDFADLDDKHEQDKEGANGVNSVDGGSSDKRGSNNSNLLRQKFQRMSEGICEVISDLGLVSFLPLNVEDGSTVGRVLAAVDRANGYSFAAVQTAEYLQMYRNSPSEEQEKSRSLRHMFALAAQELESPYSRNMEILERFGL